MPRLKFFTALTRKPGISVQAFNDHWRHPHGTLGCKVATLRKYVQSHRIDTDLLGPDQARIDGIAECWMDNFADVGTMPQEPAYVNYIVPDEPHFLDVPKMSYVITVEEILASGPEKAGALNPGDDAWDDAARSTTIKIIQLVEEAPADGWYSDRDVELGRAIGALKHARCQPADPSIPSPFIGVRELWWPTLSAFEEGVRGAGSAWTDLISQPERSLTILVQAERFK